MSLSNDDVLQILALLDASDFDELRLETSDYKLHVRRSGASPAQNGIAVPAPTTVQPQAGVERATSGSPVTGVQPPSSGSPAQASTFISGEPATAVAAGAPTSSNVATTGAPPASSAVALAPATGKLIDVKTPLLGTFYRAPQPGAPPFVDVGSTVNADTVIGIVEVMKLMSSIAAGAAGTVVELLATDGALVEYGQVLMRLAPPAA